MTRKELTLIGSWLYRNERSNHIRQQIYAILEGYGLHGTTEIPDHSFVELLPDIKRIQVALKIENDTHLAASKKYTKRS